MISSNPGPMATTRLGRWPLGLLGMIAIVATFEVFLARHDLDFTEMSAADWRLSRRAASGPAVDAEILCLGDSLLKFGIVPEVIQRRTGLRTFNLSILGGQAVTSSILLREALAAGARPKAIVLDCQDLPCKPGLGVRGLALPFHRRSWPELLGPADAIELAWAAGDASFFGDLMARRLLPSLKARDQVRSEFLRLIRKGTTKSRFGQYVQRRNWRVNRGSLLMAPKATNLSAIRPEQFAEGPTQWCPDPVTTTYLRTLLATAAERKIPVFWLIPPTTPEHEGLRVRVGQHDYFTRLALDIQAEFPGLMIVEGRVGGYARWVFIDDSHLDRVGAVAFSADLAEVIATRLDRPGDAPAWTTLPPYRERPAVGPLEDLDQSRLAIHTLGSPRR